MNNSLLSSGTPVCLTLLESVLVEAAEAALKRTADGVQGELGTGHTASIPLRPGYNRASQVAQW